MRFWSCFVNLPLPVLKFGLVMSLAATLVGIGIFNAAFSVPTFYAEQLSLSAEQLQSAGEEMNRKFEQLNRDITQPGTWEISFSEQQINAWLANELLTRLPHALPPHVFDPRVAIEPNLAKIAAQYSCGNLAAVLSLEVDPFVVNEANDVAIRICGAKIGSVPAMADQARRSIQYAAIRSRIRVRWQREPETGDWIGKFKFDGEVFDLSPSVQLRSIKLCDGMVCLSGETLAASSGSQPDANRYSQLSVSKVQR